MYNEKDYAKVIKGTIAEYLEADGFNQWDVNFSKTINNVITNPSISKDELEEILYGDYIDLFKNTQFERKLSKEAYFKKENAEISTEKIKRYSDDIIDKAICVEDEIKFMRQIYSKLKSFNFGQNKDEKVSYDVMNCLHSYLINGIQSYKNLSTACIELCIKAFNLYNKYNGDMDKVNEEISTYDMSDEMQKEYVNKWKYNKIKNPSDNANLEFIRQNPLMIKNIKNPTEEMQLIAVDRNPTNIKYIKNPTEKVLKAVVSHKWFYAASLKDRDLSESIQLEIVNKDPFNIEYIKDPTDKVQLAAVEREPSCIIDIKNPTEEAQLSSVKDNSYYFQFIKNPTDKVIKLVAEKHGEDKYMKDYFKKLSKEMQNKMIKINPELKKYL